MITEKLQELLTQWEGNIYGQQHNLRLLTAAILAGGHVLLEGRPGLGKTKMVRTFAQLCQSSFQRIQFTPDMMPSDITGNAVFNMKESTFQIVKGPVFTNILLADEINRTPPKTQAALLEAMEERQVTILGETYALPAPFFVIATQNPLEYEGTYPLPEAQLDRFLFKLIIDYPDAKAEKDILRSYVNQAEPAELAEQQVKPVLNGEEIRTLQDHLNHVSVEESVIDYIIRLIRSSREYNRISLGASTRAGVSILLASKAWALLNGRDFVTPDDVKIVIYPALRHRIQINPQAELEGATGDQVIQEIVASVPVPR